MTAFLEGTPTATIDLDKPRVLAFTMGAMRRAQELGVLNVDVSNETALMLAMPEYVWACLPDADRKELSVEAISELISPHNMKRIAEQLAQLFKASLPDVPEGNGSPAAAMEQMRDLTAGKQSTLSSSGQSV